MQSFMLHILYYVFVYNTVSCIYTGCFFTFPPYIVRVWNSSPINKIFEKFHTGPPQHQNYSMFRADSVPKQPRT